VTGDVGVVGDVVAERADVTRHYRGRWYGFPLWLAVASAGILYDASNPGFMTLLSLPALAIWVWIAIAWAVRLVQWVLGTSALRSVLVPPLVLVAVVALCAANVPLHLRFDASRAAFDASLAVEGRSLDPTMGTERIGLYEICVDETEGVLVVYTDCAGSGLVDNSGFAYAPPGTTMNLDNGERESPTYTDLGGGWWAWTASW
jgi:hypothetical protein